MPLNKDWKDRPFGPNAGETLADYEARLAAYAAANPTLWTPLNAAALEDIEARAAAEDNLRIPTSIVDAKGDLIAGTGADSVARVPAGTNGQVLIADSSQASGVRWGSGSGAASSLAAAPIVMSRDTAVVESSGKWIAPGPGTLEHVSLSCVGAPVGSALTVQWRKNGSVVATCSIPAGTASTDRQTLASVAFVAGDEIDVNVTSIGSTTAATKFVTQLWYTLSSLSAVSEPPFDTFVSGIANVVSHWKQGETSGTTMADSIGSNPGVYVNTPLLGQTGIVANPTTDTAVLYNGTDEYATIAGTASLQSTRPTAWAWISLPAAPASERTLWSFADACFGLRITSSRTARAFLWNGSQNVFSSGAVVIPTNTPTLISATYDGTLLNLYVNGVLDSAAGAGAIVYTSGVFSSVLAAGSGGATPLNVKMQKAGYVNRALNATEHLQIYQAGT